MQQGDLVQIKNDENTGLILWNRGKIAKVVKVLTNFVILEIRELGIRSCPIDMVEMFATKESLDWFATH